MISSRRSLVAVASMTALLSASSILAGCGTVEQLLPTTQTSPVPSTSNGGPEATGTETTVAPVPVTETVPPLDPAFDAIAVRTTMTPAARDLLARSSPELADRSTLGTSCTLEPDVSVLGCYQTGHITVLAVTDPRLDGMTETTAAHEMLHAAWAGLDAGERDQLRAELEAAFQRAVTPELTDRIDAYRTLDPAVIDSELHSILGTEVADLGPELEGYYARWFTDRSAVVALAVQAQSTFTSLRAQVDDLDGQLANLRSQITSEETSLADQRASLEARSVELDDLRNAGRIDEYNAGVDPFNRDVAAYNDAVAAHRDVVDHYNNVVQQRNDLAAAYTDLAAQIDTTAQSMAAS